MDWLVRQSFYITYVFLLTTATITFIEAMRTSDGRIRHILNLETCISVVAAYFYGRFVEQIKDDELDYAELNRVRYTDWSITTPLMLLVLALALLYNSKGGKLNFRSFVLILTLNYAMLASGYAGEVGYIPRQYGLAVGFAAFFGLFGYVYAHFVRPKLVFDNAILFGAFLVLWAGYGVLYYVDDQEARFVGYNVLDLLAKCFVGIFFWAYFTKVFTLK